MSPGRSAEIHQHLTGIARWLRQDAQQAASDARRQSEGAQQAMAPAQNIQGFLEARAAVRKSNGEIRRRHRDIVLDSVVAAVIAATQATAGYIQILEPGTEHPAVRAHKGLRAQVREHLDSVDCRQSPYATALKTGRRVIRHRDTNGGTSTVSPATQCLLHSEAQTIQATPLMGESGQTLGVLSTHYRDSSPDATELLVIDQFARRAVSIVEWHRRALTNL